MVFADVRGPVRDKDGGWTEAEAGMASANGLHLHPTTLVHQEPRGGPQG